MQTIGERLEEARKKRGVTLQEAAEFTKIRQEYLLALEKADGREIPLPVIYIRGYIRNYAKFLRLEPSRLLTDYDANTRAEQNTQESAKADKELIGRLELGSEHPPVPTLPSETAADTQQQTAIAQERGKVFKLASKLPSWAWPVAIGFVSVLLLAGVIVGVSSCSAKAQATKSAQAAPSEIKLTALGDVTVTVRELDSEVTLFAGSMKKGEEKTLIRRGSVRVQYSDGNLVEAQAEGGKRTKMGASGAGKRVID